jgi:hypothetical protein
MGSLSMMGRGTWRDPSSAREAAMINLATAIELALPALYCGHSQIG